MKIKELKEQLNKYDDESIVILQLDSETGDHAPLDAIWSGIYVATSEYYGEILADEDIAEYGVECIILCPIY
jgi:hypothetical protein